MKSPYLKSIVAAAIPLLATIANLVASGNFSGTTILGLVTAAVAGAGTYVAPNVAKK